VASAVEWAADFEAEEIQTMMILIQFIAGLRRRRRERLAAEIARYLSEDYLSERLWRLEHNIGETVRDTVREVVREEHERMRGKDGDSMA
jgi:hypothetical protein